MDFSLNDDHLALRAAVARYCEQEYPAHERGNPQTAQQAAARWYGMAELGLMGLPVAEQHGGSALGTVELMLVAQELGTALAGGAWLASTALCAPLLAQASAAQQACWLPPVASGALQLALAHAEEHSRYTLQQVDTRASRHGDAWRITGCKTLVLHGDTAGLLLVLARTGGTSNEHTGLSLFAVASDAPGVRINGFDTLDNRRAAHISLDQSPGELIGAEGQAWAPFELSIDRAIAVLCGEAAGALDALLVQTAEHLRTRKQFGQPLAKFQALQHRLADMLIALEQIKSLACAAAMAVDSGDVAQRRRFVSAAKTLTGQLGRKAGLDAIQLFGGMGMTDECRVGHYAKRLMVINQLFGDASHHLQSFASQSRSTTQHPDPQAA